MLREKLRKFKIILASRSPRRRELLHDLGLDFEVRLKNWNEDYPPDLKGHEIAVFLAENKAKAYAEELEEDEIVITADTVVWCNDETLDKPSDSEDARNILRKISGRTHEVITGVCILSKDRQTSFFSSTSVTFSDLSDEEIEYYIGNYNPYDKAGAYGIQDWIGIAACSRIEGSYFNVMGLPSEQLYRELKKFIIHTTDKIQ